MKRIPLAIAVVSVWVVPVLALAWRGYPIGARELALAAGIGLVHGAVLTAGFVLALRLVRGALVRAGLIGAVVGLVLGGWMFPVVAALAGTASGATIAAYLCTEANAHWYPRAPATERPSHRWYWGRALYVSRRDYARIFVAFASVGLPLGTIGLLMWRPLFDAAVVVAIIGLALLGYSLVGLYRMYGACSLRYYRRLLAQGRVRDGAVIADLHIGTYRTAFALADLLPAARVHSIDCWNVDGEPAEAAVADVRELEPPPTNHPRIAAATATAMQLPLGDASCDAVVFGFGTHEIPTGGPRETLFAEAKRVLKPGGVALLFEHGYDLHNYFIFGPVIDHVTRRGDWLATMRRYFADVTIARSSAAVDLLAGVRHA